MKYPQDSTQNVNKRGRVVKTIIGDAEIGRGISDRRRQDAGRSRASPRNKTPPRHTCRIPHPQSDTPAGSPNYRALIEILNAIIVKDCYKHGRCAHGTT